MSNQLQITLFARSKKLCRQWVYDFMDYKNITVVHIADFKDLPTHDCMVSPANSFGLMDGGFDMALRDYFDDIQNKVQVKINEVYNGIQPVGTSLIIETGDIKFPYLVHAPTMMIPEEINNTVNVFLAFRSILWECKRHGKINSLACTGLGHGVGKMSEVDVSKQMKQAYDTQEYKFPSWEEVIKHVLLE